ncbi:hypothetical protein COT63_01945 [Candidatus Shapirobacteria bacterium CG09_land_8_20_14_0_10_38_17]|uniref:Nucleoid-associated protein, YbaB/EbfC family n=1 Tax=Candidatus Shapirobacteria bacterium CG09_land_8_20_14_0_10_38_17 TaxID=1974884 RepID=A0A2H0WT04_9BACT|nr:MAG: hypothetical protein COT63_01945 [Candidatus Shapirobacteria bacterium CG09_land_8_20_14_0_10_38_17]
MFNSLKQLGNLRQLQKQAKEIQRQLANEEVEVEENGVRVVVSGEQRIKKLLFEKENISPLVVMEAINRALGKAQQLAAKKLMGKVGI